MIDAVEKDLAEYEARMDREAAYEAAIEGLEEEIYSEFISGERSAEADQELEETIGMNVSVDDLVQAVMGDDSEARDRLVSFLHAQIEKRCRELAPQVLKAERQAAEEAKAEDRAMDRGLI